MRVCYASGFKLLFSGGYPTAISVDGIKIVQTMSAAQAKALGLSVSELEAMQIHERRLEAMAAQAKMIFVTCVFSGSQIVFRSSSHVFKPIDNKLQA